MQEEGEKPRLLVVGLGCIGVACGATLGLKLGLEVRFLSRPSSELDAVNESGLCLTFPEGNMEVFRPAMITSDAQLAYANVNVILVCTKRSANADVAKSLAQFAPQNCLVCMLQNGLKQAEEFHDVLASYNRQDLVCSNTVVHFNAVKLAPGAFKWVVSHFPVAASNDAKCSLLASAKTHAYVLY